MEAIKFDEWKKLDIRTAKIKSAEDHPNADKLQVLKVDLGGREIQLVAGLKDFYKNEELVGKQIVVVTNLEPATLRGIKSEGMLLAAVERENGKEKDIVLIQPEKEVKEGLRIE
ncbi:methionine--tRNA ligase subunit beta [Candidatus Pacearchaeota archaeon ex4484_26]|nr:MAG: methionine--tRNA ligase subunit beta [Candidatus Pacearchaeota archaeon ex4484_26]